MDQDVITITRAEYNQLLKDSKTLSDLKDREFNPSREGIFVPFYTMKSFMKKFERT